MALLTLGLTVSATVDGFASPRLWHAISVFHTVVFPQPAGPRIMTLKPGVTVDGCRRAVKVSFLSCLGRTVQFDFDMGWGSGFSYGSADNT